MSEKFKAKKRIDGPCSPSNGERADRAQLALGDYLKEEEFDTALADLLSDLMHLAHREKGLGTGGHNEPWPTVFDEALGSGSRRYEEER